MKKALNENFVKAIKEIGQKLQGIEKWAVMGTTNLALHGIDVVPNDLDITTNHEGLEKISEILAEYKVGEPEVKQPFVPGFREFTEQEFEINGVKVTVCGEYEDDIYYRSFVDGGIKRIDFAGVSVPVFSLPAEAKAYRALEREDKAKLIEDFLRKK